MKGTNGSEYSDTLVDGGAGRDVRVVTGEAGVTVDLAATGLEVVVGGAGEDSFALNGSGDTLQMAAGGGALAVLETVGQYC